MLFSASGLRYAARSLGRHPGFTAAAVLTLALGAQAYAVKRMFVRYALALAAIGIAAGLAGTAAFSRWMASLLFDVRPLDPATYVAVLGVLLGAVMLAAYPPARRASKLDPAGTLRAE